MPKMAELLFGGETEYAVASGRRPHSDFDGGAAADLMRVARTRLIHLPDTNNSSGLYLSNGARLYVDCGSHPEYSTPECTNPWDLVRHVEAGHRILDDLARGEKEARGRGREILCLRSNVDYSGTRATWASHESYLTKNAPARLKAQLIPHLATRPIYTGAGGFNPLVDALEFSLSPRMAYFENAEADDTTHGRGIWNGRQEPLSTGYHRLHVTCGESLCSQTATFLKFGVTALVVAMADAGLKPAAGFRMANPVAALHAVIADPTCSARVTSGEPALSAIQVQRHYLALAESHLNDEFMPPWAGKVCEKWRDILDRLEAGPEAVARTLDWAIKHALYTNHLRNMGDDSAAARDRKHAQVLELFPPVPEDSEPVKTSRRDMVISGEAEEDSGPSELLTERAEFPTSDANPLRRRHNQMFEIDVRFGQVGGAGLFDALDRGGVLDHRVVEDGEIVRAMTNPPEGSRARLRGEVVRRLTGTHGAQCDWQRIVDGRERRLLDLSNPFASEEWWREITVTDTDDDPWQREVFDGSQHPLRRRVRAYEVYLDGNYSGAEQLLRELIAENYETASNRCHLARALILMGRDLEAREEIALAWEARAAARPYVVPRILFFRYVFAVLDGGDCSDPLAEIKAVLVQGRNAHESWTIGPMLEHLRPRLGEENFVFLEALAAGLSDSANLGGLEEFSQWRDAPGSAAAAS